MRTGKDTPFAFTLAALLAVGTDMAFVRRCPSVWEFNLSCFIFLAFWFF